MDTTVDKVIEMSQAVGLKGWQVILLSIATYLLCMLVQYWLSVRIKKKDVVNNRKIKIADLSISAEVELFQGLYLLRGYQKTEIDELLVKVQELYKYLNNNKILYSKRLFNKAEEILSYYSGLCGDFTKKDAKKEMSLFEDFIKIFNE